MIALNLSKYEKFKLNTKDIKSLMAKYTDKMLLQIKKFHVNLEKLF